MPISRTDVEAAHSFSQAFNDYREIGQGKKIPRPRDYFVQPEAVPATLTDWSTDSVLQTAQELSTVFEGNMDRATLTGIVQNNPEFRNILIALNNISQIIHPFLEKIQAEKAATLDAATTLTDQEKEKFKETLKQARFLLAERLLTIENRLKEIAQLIKKVKDSEDLFLPPPDDIDVNQLNQEQEAIQNEKNLLVAFLKVFYDDGQVINVEDEANSILFEKQVAQAEQEGKFTPRNDFERFLFSNKVFAGRSMEVPPIPNNETKAEQDARAEVLKQRYGMLRSIFLTIPLNWVGDEDIVIDKLEYPYLGAIPVKVPGSNREDYKFDNLYPDMVNGLTDPVEVSVANETIGAIERDFKALKVIQEKTDSFVVKGGNQSTKGIREHFPADGTDFNADFWHEKVFRLPALARRVRLQNGEFVWLQEQQTMGDQIFAAFKEMLVRGRTDAKTKLQLSYLKHVDLNGPKVLLKDGDWNWAPKVVSSLKVPAEAVYPWVYAEARVPDLRRNSFFQIVERINQGVIFPDGISPSDIDPGDLARTVNEPHHLNAQWATLQALSIGEITGESAYQDCMAAKDSGEDKQNKMDGSPMGLTLFNRLFHPTEYIYKDVTQNGAYNNRTLPLTLAGVVRSYYLTYFDFFGYDGKTFTQHIMEASSPDEVRWEFLPTTASRDYGTAVKDTTTIYEAEHPDVGKQDPRGAGTLDFVKKAPVKVNDGYFDAKTNLLKARHKYKTERDANVKAAINQTELKKQRARVNAAIDALPGLTIEQKAARKAIPLLNEIDPTGQYWEIRVVDENGNPLKGHNEAEKLDKDMLGFEPDTTIHTRLQEFQHMGQPDIEAWIETDDFKERVIGVSTSREAVTVLGLDGQVKTHTMPVTTIKVRRRTNGDLGIYPWQLLRRYNAFCQEYTSWNVGSIIKDIRREDAQLVGMFYSPALVAEYRTRKTQGYVRGRLVDASLKITNRGRAPEDETEQNWATQEVPNIPTIDLFSLQLFWEMLRRLGYEIKIEDLAEPSAGIFGVTAFSKK